MPTSPPRLPTFFILGAAKSGTTSLYAYLDQHPDIFMSNPKEPTFFNESQFQVIKDPISYVGLFDGAGDARHRGEASHPYLSQPKAPRAMRAFFPDAQFVVILRDPVERAHSLYCHMRRLAAEPASTFERALELEPERLVSPKYKASLKRYFYNFMYVGSGRYDEQLARYFELFDREQFLVLTTDELRADSSGVVKQIHRFLGVDELDLEVTSRRNEGEYGLRWPRFYRAITNKTPHLGPLRAPVDAVMDAGFKLPHPVLREDTRLRLQGELDSSVRRLAELLDRDPLWWTAAEPGPAPAAARPSSVG